MSALVNHGFVITTLLIVCIEALYIRERPRPTNLLYKDNSYRYWNKIKKEPFDDNNMIEAKFRIDNMQAPLTEANKRQFFNFHHLDTSDEAEERKVLWEHKINFFDVLDDLENLQESNEQSAESCTNPSSPICVQVSEVCDKCNWDNKNYCLCGSTNATCKFENRKVNLCKNESGQTASLNVTCVVNDMPIFIRKKGGSEMTEKTIRVCNVTIVDVTFSFP